MWATLQAYGRQGQQRIVEHCLDLAQHFGEQVRLHPQLELLNEVQLNIVAFRYNPGGLDEAALNALNQRLGQAVIDDGRFLVGTSRIGSTTVFRPAFSNWRTRFADVEDFAKVVVEVAAGLGNTATEAERQLNARHRALVRSPLEAEGRFATAGDHRHECWDSQEFSAGNDWRYHLALLGSASGSRRVAPVGP